jgi:hypothetical protein
MRTGHRLGVMRAFFETPLDDVAVALEATVVAGPRRVRAAVLLLGSIVLSWWVYVPVHELLHALGCVVAGGTVHELQIAPIYGAALLARLFPFVVAGGPYAGRLSGFDTHGSDLVYLATDALPFALTLVVGVPLLLRCRRGPHPLHCGAAIVLAAAPFYSLTGDYYEMGSVIVTRLVGSMSVAGVDAFAPLRSDDAVDLVGRVFTDAPALVPGLPRAAALAVVAASLATGTFLAFATYAAGRVVARAMGAEPA